MGFAENNKAACMRNVLIDTHLLEAARDEQLDSYFYASTACVYPGYLRYDPDVIALKEADTYRAHPDDGYRLQKLFGERLCLNFGEDYGIPVRVGRYHNVYGPEGTWDGGREKAPAAIDQSPERTRTDLRPQSHVVNVSPEPHCPLDGEVS
jgi:GDP-D-mannose 3',5'-epimerase